jgi:phosphoribosylglycinamide formyltransferase 1
MSVRVAVFASGNGSNLQSILERCPPALVRVALVVSDRADAGALARAGRIGIPHQHIAVRGRDTGAVAAEMLAALQSHDIQLVALAGYLRLVPAEVIAAFPDRLVNIHPALLPSFGGPGMYGRRVHEAVIAAGCRVSGATVHHVDERFDEGRIIAQWPVPVFPADDAAALARRVLEVEHVLYPAAIALLAHRVAQVIADATVHPHGEDTFRLGAATDDLASEVLRTAAP